MTSLNHIYQHPHFSPKLLDIITQAHVKVQIPRGTYLLRSGQMANEYYCVENGLLRSYAIDLKGNDITTDFYGVNDIAMDVVSLIQRIPAKENLHTITDCICWKINFENFQRLFHSVEGFTEWGRAWMTQMLFKSKQRSISMITETAGDRYLGLQMEHPEIIRQAPLKYISSYLGITDTSLSRIRHELSKSTH